MIIKDKKAPDQTTLASPTSSAEKQLRDVASLYEKQFLREMVKQMRSSVSESELMPSSFAEKYYREQLDHQYVESWGDRGGIGFGQLIYNQLVERYGAQMGIRLPQDRPLGPINLTHRDNWSGQIQKQNSAVQFQRTSSVIDTKENPSSPESTPLQSPWDGEWLGTFTLPSGDQVTRIQHGDLISSFVGEFKFPSDTPFLNKGAAIKKGDVFGYLHPNAQTFYWKIQPRVE